MLEELLGFNQGKISKCRNLNIITGKYYVGGITGYNYDGYIERCSNDLNINGYTFVGGIVRTCRA